MAFATCIASSRVGASTSAEGFLPRSPSGSALRMGSAKAAVLPVPVAAWPTRSCPVSSAGIASLWIGVGSSYPRAVRAARSSGRRPRWEKRSPSGCIPPFSQGARSAPGGRSAARLGLRRRLGLLLEGPDLLQGGVVHDVGDGAEAVAPVVTRRLPPAGQVE